MLKVGIVMGSDSDFPVVKGAVKVLKDFGVPYEVRVMSAHRTPDAAADFSKNVLLSWSRASFFFSIAAKGGKSNGQSFGCVRKIGNRW